MGGLNCLSENSLSGRFPVRVEYKRVSLVRIEECREKVATDSLHVPLNVIPSNINLHVAAREFCQCNYSSKLVDFELTKREIMFGPE